MIAVDTNILVYAVDANEPTKGAQAVALLKELQSKDTVLLWQVVCECGAALLRKKPKSRDAGVTRLYTEDMQGRPVIEGVEIVNPFK